jgi:hypothetical protein
MDRFVAWWTTVGGRMRWSILVASAAVAALVGLLIFAPGFGPRRASSPGVASPASSLLAGAISGLSPTPSASPSPSAKPTAKPTPRPTVRATPLPPRSTARPTLPPPPPAGAVYHVIWVILENHAASAITGSSMPYLTRLATTHGLATNYFAVSHPSEPNYIAMTSGGLNGVTNDDTYNLGVTSIFTQGESWRAYEQNDTGACFTGSSRSGGIDGPGVAGTYARKHNPAISYTMVSRVHAQCAHIQPLSSFNPTAASFEFVTPNLCNDAHDCSLGAADAFLRGFVPLVTRSPDFAHTMLVITFDEGSSSAGSFGDLGGHVYTAVVAPWLHGVRSNRYFDHYSLLHTAESALGLPCLASACQRSAMTEFLP